MPPAYLRLRSALLPTASAWALLIVTASCAAQAEPDYQGEAVVVLRGLVRADAATQELSVDPVLAWANFVGRGDFAVAQRVRVDAAFPAQFNMGVFTPPPEAALNDATRDGAAPREIRFGTAFLIALRRGGSVNVKEDHLGVAEDHIVVYAERDVEPDTQSERFFGGRLRAGFHLMRVVRRSPGAPDSEGFFDKLQEEPRGFDVAVPLRVAPRSALRFPNFT